MAAGSRSKFQQLAITHAAMMGGEAAMIVALADSFFFDVDPSGARSKVLAFLLVSFTPFLVVAPFIGPVIDRVRGGRRFVVQAVAAARIVVQLLMIRFSDDTPLFGLVFVALVLQKTYQVSKSALVPAVVRTDRELVEANSKLGLIAGLAGVVAVLPAALLQAVIGSAATLAYSAALFVVALVSSLRLPRELALRPDAPSAASREALTPSVQLAWAAMLILRAAAGFMLFLLAFEFRGRDDDGNVLLGAAILLSSLGTMAGNALAPSIRGSLHEERMIGLALGLPALAGLAAAATGGDRAGIALAFVVGFSAALCRLSFESIVQRDGPAANRGQAFARFETQFQFGWVVAAVLPVLLPMPGRVGYLMVGAVMVAALVSYITGVRTDEAVARRVTRR
ncbi:MAG TPA: MFS transporter [Ilumatobacter sp.]|nr:MFS transporter [Ilumatobacter sp.]